MIKEKEKEYFIIIMEIDEGDWKNDKREGKGIFYYNNGNREMGDYLKDKRIGKHVSLLPDGKVKINNY